MNWYRKSRMSRLKLATPTTPDYVQCKNPNCRKGFLIDFDPPNTGWASRAYEANPWKQRKQNGEHGMGVFRCIYCGQPFDAEYDFNSESFDLDLDYEPISEDEFSHLRSSGLPEFQVVN